MKVCIIGGGLAGLCAALRLKGRHEVDLYEKKGHLGGCLCSYRIDDYWIEQFYHHCFSGDRNLLALFSELKSGTGWNGGKVHPAIMHTIPSTR